MKMFFSQVLLRTQFNNITHQLCNAIIIVT